MTRIIGTISSGAIKNLSVAYVYGTKMFSSIDLVVATTETPNILDVSASACASNNRVAAYALGGDFGPINGAIRKLTFLTEVTSSISATLPAPKAYTSGFTNNGVSAYVAGGLTTGYSRTSSVVKMAYSNETTSTTNSLSTNVGYNVSWSNSGTDGYSVSGFTGSYVATVNRITYSNDSWSATTSLATGRQYPASVSNQGIAGYVAGGGTSSTTRTNSIEKFVFSSSTRTALSAILSETVYAGYGTSNSGLCGFFSGGSNSGNTTATSRNQKLTYSNDTISTIGNLARTTWYGGSGIETW